MAEFQSLVPATLPPGTVVKTDTMADGKIVEYVKLDIGGTGESVPVTADVLAGSWLCEAGRSVVITYTDATKATIQKVDFKDGGITSYTLTQTQAATTDTWTRS